LPVVLPAPPEASLVLPLSFLLYVYEVKVRHSTADVRLFMLDLRNSVVKWHPAVPDWGHSTADVRLFMLDLRNSMVKWRPAVPDLGHSTAELLKYEVLCCFMVALGCTSGDASARKRAAAPLTRRLCNNVYGDA
jgi:hypothetical protein